MKKEEGRAYERTWSRGEHEKYLGKWNQRNMELKGGQCLCHKGLFILWTLGGLLTIPFIDNLYSPNCLLHLKVLLSSWTTSISNPLGFTLLSLYSTLMTSMSLLHLCARRSLHSSLLVSQKKRGGGLSLPLYSTIFSTCAFKPILSLHLWVIAHKLSSLPLLFPGQHVSLNTLLCTLSIHLFSMSRLLPKSTLCIRTSKDE